MAYTLRDALRTHAVLNADETPAAMLKPGHGKMHRVYLCSHCTTSFHPPRSVNFDFAESSSSQHSGSFLDVAHDACLDLPLR